MNPLITVAIASGIAAEHAAVPAHAAPRRPSRLAVLRGRRAGRAPAPRGSAHQRHGPVPAARP